MLATGTLPRFDHGRRASEFDGLHTLSLPRRITESAEREITIRLADRDGERHGANMLINRKFAARGYGGNHRVPTAGNCVTFTASSEATLVGTLSLTVDAADGLAADKTFKDELDDFRARGARICELTKFAFETTKPSLDLLASLFHIIFIYGTHRYDCTDLFIEVCTASSFRRRKKLASRCAYSANPAQPRRALPTCIDRRSTGVARSVRHPTMSGPVGPCAFPMKSVFYAASL
jgi:hypothetical protein